MYVAGVIPGPDKPSKEDIYSYLEVLVAELKEFWQPGVFFSRTHREALGRLILALLIPVICDMLAARQVIGLSSPTSHNFCSFCDLDIDDIDVVDRREWPLKDVDHVRHYAQLWRDAPSEKAQEILFNACGIKWTPLLDLPYWNPVLHTVIDSMHALDLNLLQNHCRNLFQIDPEKSGNVDTPIVAAGAKQKGITTKHDLNSLKKSQRQEFPLQQIEMSSLPGAHILPPKSGLDMVLVARVVRHIVNTDDQVASRSKAYTQGSTTIFSYICELLEIDQREIDTTKRGAKRTMCDLIISAIDDNLEAFEELSSYIKEEVPNSNRAILDREMMHAVWADMTRSQLPTWITPPPPNWGTAKRGKLSADNWRVICTIHLPVTLIRLWGHDTGRRKELLDNFMDLVAAVRVANMRLSSENQIQLYHDHIERYVRNLRRLFPDQHLKPSHHAALHIGDMLHSFGPNHSHSGPHYERYINFFHRINTNEKFGELEATFLKSSARYGNIRALLSDDTDVRALLRELVEVMAKIESEDVRGYRLAMILDLSLPDLALRAQETPGYLEDKFHRLLCGYFLDETPPTNAVTFCKEISFRGVCYGVLNSTSFKNSSVIFSMPTTDMVAGIIIKIFRHSFADHSEKDTYLIVQELVLAGPGTQDPYRQYGFCGGFLCRPDPGSYRLIRINQIISHFVMTRLVDEPFKDLIHVLPVDRLMYEFASQND
ncbi:hypothetical protein NLJ89_g9593 [Agrocybe chaxingu]|uniref:Uncharacterized protein n=1 Tax=Agrocybe chaxingu TaxID=84603 RepID=A0A9W8MSY5_9AGAR|nr:hypothetical protein NLJ89_g9593 [Agrocybe chaxingu]